MCDSALLRYGVAVALAILAAGVTLYRPALKESPYFVFTAAVVLSALFGGLAPAFITTALSLVLIKVLFIVPELSLYLGGHPERMERVGVFAIVALMLACLASALRRERNSLRASEERYRILSESASDGILVIDATGEVVFANLVAGEIFGVSTQRILGCHLSSLVPEKDYARYLVDAAYHTDSRIKPQPVRVKTHDLAGRDLLLELTFGVFTRHGKNLFTTIVRDLTRCAPVPAPVR